MYWHRVCHVTCVIQYIACLTFLRPYHMLLYPQNWYLCLLLIDATMLAHLVRHLWKSK